MRQSNYLRLLQFVRNDSSGKGALRMRIGITLFTPLFIRYYIFVYRSFFPTKMLSIKIIRCALTVGIINKNVVFRYGTGLALKGNMSIQIKYQWR